MSNLRPIYRRLSARQCTGAQVGEVVRPASKRVVVTDLQGRYTKVEATNCPWCGEPYNGPRATHICTNDIE